MDSYDIFARYGLDLPDNATDVLETLQHKVEMVGGRKNKMLFVDPVLEQALLWSRQAMALKEKRLSDAFGKSASSGFCRNGIGLHSVCCAPCASILGKVVP